MSYTDNQLEMILITPDVIEQVFSDEPQDDPTILAVREYVARRGWTKADCEKLRDGAPDEGDIIIHNGEIFVRQPSQWTGVTPADLNDAH